MSKMSEFNYTEWMQQNKVGPFIKASLKESHEANDQWYEDFQDGLRNLVNNNYIDKYSYKYYVDALDHIDPMDNYSHLSGHDAAKEFVDDLRTQSAIDKDKEKFRRETGLEEDENDDARDARANKMEDDDTEAENAERDLDESEGDDKVDKVIQKYESVLLKALAMRSENPEDIDAHDAVKKVLETIASVLGLDSTIPFMENDYYSGNYTPKEALEYTKEMFHDWMDEQGQINEAGNMKGIKIEIPGNSSAVDFGKAAARELVESFGARDFKYFLQAFTEEISKLTSR